MTSMSFNFLYHCRNSNEYNNIVGKFFSAQAYLLMDSLLQEQVYFNFSFTNLLISRKLGSAVIITDLGSNALFRRQSGRCCYHHPWKPCRTLCSESTAVPSAPYGYQFVGVRRHVESRRWLQTRSRTITWKLQRKRLKHRCKEYEDLRLS